MSNSEWGAIPRSLADDVSNVIEKKMGTSSGYKPSEWEDQINLMGKLPEKTVSGAIAHITDGADRVPLKELIFSASPVQAAGTPSPSNPLPISGHTSLTGVHCGKNLLNPVLYDGGAYNPTVDSQRTFAESATQFTHVGNTYSVTFTESWKNFTMLMPVKYGQAYYCNFTLSGTGTNLGTSVYFVDADNKVMASASNNTSNPQTRAFALNVPSGAKYFCITFTNRGTAETTLTFTEPQIEVGSSATSFAPYSAESKKWEFPPFGKNQLTSAQAETKSNNSVSIVCDGNGTYKATGTATGGSANITFALAKPYTIKSGDYFHTLNSGANASVSITLQKQDNTSIMYFSLSPANRIVDLSSYVGQTIYSLRFYVASGAEFAMSVSPMICDSSTATAYEPYQSMFSGSVNALTGEVTVTHILKEYAVANMNNSDNYPGWKNAGVRELGVSGGYVRGNTNIGGGYSINVSSNNDIVYLSVNDFGMTQTQWIANYPDLVIQILIQLATPIEKTLDSVSWNTKLEDNNFYNDCGDTALGYRSYGTETIVTPTLISKSITENGTYNASSDNADGYSSVTVNTPVPTIERLCYVDYVGRDTEQIPVVNSMETSDNYASYLSYDSTTGKFTVLQDFSAIVVTWVKEYRSGGLYSNGSFFINDEKVGNANYTIPTNDLDDTRGLVMWHNFKANDTFYNYTNTSQGWPQQQLKIYRITGLDFTDTMASFTDET